MVVAEDGALLVTEDGARIRRISPDGIVSTLAGGEVEDFADGPGRDARFSGASGLAVDREGNVLVVETSGRIRKILPGAMVFTLAGSTARGGTDGALLEATFDTPTGIAIARNGDIFILEPGKHRIRKLSNDRVTTFHQGMPAQ